MGPTSRLFSVTSIPIRNESLRSVDEMLEALLRHDWVYRWNEMLRVAGIEPSPRMAARERHLKDMADFVASAKKKADTAPKSRTDPAGNQHK
jgi:hypothetical protein